MLQTVGLNFCKTGSLKQIAMSTHEPHAGLGSVVVILILEGEVDVMVNDSIDDDVNDDEVDGADEVVDIDVDDFDAGFGGVGSVVVVAIVGVEDGASVPSENR